MAFNLVPTTLLGAVNQLLTAIGTVPVNTLDAPGASDVAIAKDTVESISKEVQGRGWWFNRFYGKAFPASGGSITVGGEFLTIRPTLGTTTVAPEPRHVVLRGGQLYDVTTGSFSFSSTLYLDGIQLLDFEDLPEAARWYITVRAARVFQTKVLGDDQLGVFTSNHEQEAWTILTSAEGAYNPISNLYMARVRRTAEMLHAGPVAQEPERDRRR